MLPKAKDGTIMDDAEFDGMVDFGQEWKFLALDEMQVNRFNSLKQTFRSLISLSIPQHWEYQHSIGDDTGNSRYGGDHGPLPECAKGKERKAAKSEG